MKTSAVKRFAPRAVNVVLAGSRGIPPRYGGAETFVYELGKRLQSEFRVFVTCESNRFAIDTHEGFTRIHVYTPQPPSLTIPVIYDIIATLYAIKHVRPDIIYYVAPDGAYAAVIAKLARSRVVVNTDGLEWKRLLIRQKYSSPLNKPIHLLTAFALLVAEFLACKIPDATIADSLVIKHYLESRWKPRKIAYMAYGARHLPKVDPEASKKVLQKYGLAPYRYFLTVGRFVAENNLHLVIRAFKHARTSDKLVLVGLASLRDPYVKHLLKLRGHDKRIVLLPPVYDSVELSALRSSCKAYVHPYTVGGTNPSLLEQLQFDRPILVYDAPFHREILGSKGIYFKTAEELADLITKIESSGTQSVTFVDISRRFSWEVIAKKYAALFRKLAR